MNSIKCKKCGLSNFPSDNTCRRCGYEFTAKRQEKPKGSRANSLVTLVILAAVAGGAYYIFSGMQQSVSDVNTADANRVAAQPAQQQPAGLSRTEYDRQRAGQYGNAIQNSPALTEARRQEDEREKIRQQLTNSSKP